jgi:hypothetical protein
MTIMESKETDKARKELAESAREKVSSAVENFRRASEKPKLDKLSAGEKVRLPPNADKKAVDKAATDDQFLTLEELLIERRLLMRLGCFEDARAFDAKIEVARAKREKDRLETNKRVLEKKLAGLEMKQRVQRQQLLRRQTEEVTSMSEASAVELKQMIRTHAQQYHELFEQVTKAAAFEENAQLETAQGGRFIRTLAKQRYRMSKELLQMKDAAHRLEETGREVQAKETLELIRKREASEKQAWRDHFLKLALGEQDGSVLSHMLIAHKTSQAKLQEKNERALVVAKRAQMRARTRQEGTFRLEKWKVIDLCRQQGTAAYHARNDGDDAALGDDWRKKNMKVVEDDLEHGGVGQVIAARDDGTVWVAPTAFGLDNSDAIEYRDTLATQSGAAQLNSLTAENPMFRSLTKLYWLSEPTATLAALIAEPDALKYLHDFVSDEMPMHEQDLSYVLDAHGARAWSARAVAVPAPSVTPSCVRRVTPRPPSLFPSCCALPDPGSHITPHALLAALLARRSQKARPGRAIPASLRALLPEEWADRGADGRGCDEVRQLGGAQANRKARAQLLRAVCRIGDVRGAARGDRAQVVRL